MRYNSNPKILGIIPDVKLLWNQPIITVSEQLLETQPARNGEQEDMEW